ncbi:MAG TPA: diguanylate cyclase [Anaerolineaceae bacterium]|nr:diguanylate cyclase [Anaerolineaceae bacterium]
MRNKANAAKRIHAGRNARLGFLTGLLFLIFVYAYEFLRTGTRFSLNSIQQIHDSNFFFWIIDFIPFAIFFVTYFSTRTGSGTRAHALFKSIESQKKSEILKQKIFYESLINNNPAAIVTMDADQKIISINPAFSRIFQYTQDEVYLKDLDTILADDPDLGQAQEFTKTVLQGGTIYGTGKRRRKDGRLVDVKIYGVPIFLGEKRIGVLGMYLDITSRIRNEMAIKENELRYRSLFHDSPISMWEMDFSALKEWIENLEFNSQDKLNLFLEKVPDLEKEFSSLIKVINGNQATLLLFKAADLDDLQKNFNGIFIEQSAESIRSIIMALYNGSCQVETEMPCRSLDGLIIHTIVRLSLINGFEKSWSRIHLSILDITERKWAEERMRFLNMHDSMTGLYNRAYFEAEFKRISQGRQFPLSIIVCDLDNLKKINDQYGHAAGDTIICKAATILQESFRGDDIVARLGGDEFAVIISSLEESAVLKIVARLRNNIQKYNQTLPADDQAHRMNFSIGAATTHCESEVEALFKLADHRMYCEKLGKRVSTANQHG